MDVGWRQEHIHFLYLPLFTGEALRQTAKPWRAGTRSTFPSFPPNPFSQHDKISSEDKIESAMQMPSNVCFIPGMNQSSVRASYPASPDRSAVTSEGTSHGEIPLASTYNSLAPAVLV